MLRTLTINSNQIVLSFGVLIAFLSPKQSEIEESSLESINKSGMQGVFRMKNHSCQVDARFQPRLSSGSVFPVKDVRTGRPDTPSQDGGTWAMAGCRNDAARLMHFSQWSGQHIRNSAPSTFHPDVSHPEFSSTDIPPGLSHPEFCSADIPPGCLSSGILLRRHSTRMSHIRNSSPPTFHRARWERLDTGWEGLTPDGKGGRFNFPGQIYPDHLIALTRRASRYVRLTFWDIFL